MKVALVAICSAALMGCAVEVPDPEAIAAAAVAPAPAAGELSDADRILAFSLAPMPKSEIIARHLAASMPVAPGTPLFEALATDGTIVALIKNSEKLKLAAYQGPAGHWLIGYGHKRTAKPGATISEAEAEKLLRHDLAVIEEAVKRGIKRPISQREFSAMVELAYNVGPSKFLKSSVLRKFNAGDRQGAADAFLLWNKMTVNGEKVANSHLTERRRRARAHFLGESAT